MVLTEYLLLFVFAGTGYAAKTLVRPCDPHMFASSVNNCLLDFNKSMEMISYQDTCPWPSVKLNYYHLQSCVDACSNMSRCNGYLVDRVFLKVHQMYFSLCGQVQDPPLSMLVILISPVTIVALIMPLVFSKLTTDEIDILVS